jgi:hypothetical protein
VGARPFRPLGGPNEGSAVLAELARLWDQAVHVAAGWGGSQAPAGKPVTQKRLAAGAVVPFTTVNSWATGATLPRDLDQLTAVGDILARWAGEKPLAGREWARLLASDKADRSAHADTDGSGADPADVRLGRLIGELDDPFALEVHRPVQVDGAGDLPALPPYIRREHDNALAEVVTRAARGHSAMAVLVGGSAAGKTRACWEAVHQLPDGWRLWHPFDPTRPEAVLAKLRRVGPHTVVWLNETQHYLDTPSDIGERVAAALRTLLADRRRAPVLVLGTLWPEHWDTLTRERTEHSQARQVLDGTDIQTVGTFTEVALARLERAANNDPRLAMAMKAAPGGEVTQYLAGARELLSRYRNAPPAAKALIHAAMDARRLGHGIALSGAFLTAATPRYLTDAEWDTIGDDWLEQALAYTAAPCKGVPGPVCRIRPRPDARHQGSNERADGPSDVAEGSLYRLADYLDQHGRRHRADQFPPTGFWAAAAAHANPSDKTVLGDAAQNRGLYREAAQLYKDATHIRASNAERLIQIMRQADPADVRPAQWAAAHAPVHHRYEVSWLLEYLLVTVGDQQAITILTDRAAALPPNDPHTAASPPISPPKAGASRQSAARASDAAANASRNNPRDVARRLDRLLKAGASQQVTMLANHAASHVPLDDLPGVARLLTRLREADASQQIATLLERAASSIPLDNPGGVAWLLDSLRDAGASQQIATLLERDPAGCAPLGNLRGVAWLLDSLRDAGASHQFTALASRAAAHAPLDDPGGIARLLDSLRKAGASREVAMLLDRDPATRTLLNDSGRTTRLLDSLRNADATQQAAALTRRLASAGLFSLLPEHRQPQFRFGRTPDGQPADRWTWEDLS